MFLGGLPSSMEEAYKKYLLAVGLTATNFARNRRNVPRTLNMDKGRWASNPCLLDKIYSSWMCGGKSMTDDMVLNLVRSIAEPRAVSRKAHQACLSPGTAERLRRAYLGPPAERRHIVFVLLNLEFCLTTEAQDLYFDWLGFAETCQRMWSEIHAALDALGDVYGDHYGRVPPIMAMQILDEARLAQWFAEGVEGRAPADVPAYVRENAEGAGAAWDVIQRVARKGMKVSLGRRDPLIYGLDDGLRAWVGDQQIFRVLSKDIDKSIYPHLPAPLARQVYANWPLADVDRAAVLRMNLEKSQRREDKLRFDGYRDTKD